VTVGRNSDEVKPNGKKWVNLRALRGPPSKLPARRSMAGSPYAHSGSGRSDPADTPSRHDRGRTAGLP